MNTITLIHEIVEAVQTAAANKIYCVAFPTGANLLDICMELDGELQANGLKYATMGNSADPNFPAIVIDGIERE